jgi:hypothetical protein
MFAHGETVTRQRGTPEADRYNKTVIDWSNPNELDIAPCGVAQSGSIEPLVDARTEVDSDFDVFMPPGADVLASDRLVIRDLVCEVVGAPFDWLNPFTGWTPGTVARAKIVEG